MYCIFILELHTKSLNTISGLRFRQYLESHPNTSINRDLRALTQSLHVEGTALYIFHEWSMDTNLISGSKFSVNVNAKKFVLPLGTSQLDPPSFSSEGFAYATMELVGWTEYHRSFITVALPTFSLTMYTTDF